jgi:hypothetical protein
MTPTPNNRMHANRRRALQFRCPGFLGRWIGCQRPLRAAVGDPKRSAVYALAGFGAYCKVLS